MKHVTGLAIALAVAFMLLSADTAQAGVRFGVSVARYPPPFIVVRSHHRPLWSPKTGTGIQDTGTVFGYGEVRDAAGQAGSGDVTLGNTPDRCTDSVPSMQGREPENRRHGVRFSSRTPSLLVTWFPRLLTQMSCQHCHVRGRQLAHVIPTDIDCCPGVGQRD